MRIIVFGLIWLIGASSFLKAQYCGKVTYGQEEGLLRPSSNLFCDSKGQLWAGSQYAVLQVFDGKKWRRISEKGGLLNASTNPRFEDKEGGLWISHHILGVSRYIDGRFQQYVSPRPSADRLKEGQKWFPYFSFVHVLFYNKKKEVPVTFFQDSSKQFWIFEYDYATRDFGPAMPFFEEAEFEKYAPYLEYDRLDKNWLYLDGKGDYCLSLSWEGQNHLVYQDGTFVTLPQAQSGPVWHLPDAEGKLRFFKKEKNQLWTWEASGWKAFPAPDLQRYGADYQKTELQFEQFISANIGYGGNNIFSLWRLLDPAFPNHFIIAEHEAFSHEIRRLCLVEEDEKVWPTVYMIRDKAGTYWYGNGEELVRLFPDQMIVPALKQDMPSDNWALAGTPDGKMWFSSYAGAPEAVGLRAFDGLKLTKPVGELASIYSFSEGSLTDGQGHIYFPSNKGYLDENEHGIIKMKEDASFGRLCQGIRGFYLDWDRQGRLMYVTRSDGLWMLPSEREGIDTADWIKVDARKGLRMERLRTALQDQHGNYWIGSHLDGLAVYLPQQDTVYNWLIDRGDINYRIRAMAEDSRGNLWLGTDRGLCLMKNDGEPESGWNMRDRLQAVGEDYFGGKPIEVCKLYNAHTLILGNSEGYYLLDLDAWYANPGQLFFQAIRQDNGHQGKGIFTNGIWIDHRQDVWMVCSGGALRYSPGALPKDTLMPAVSIDSLEAGKHIFTDFSQKIQLGATQNTIRIYFSQEVSPLLLDNTRFRFRLSGDKNWSELYDKEWIDYRNLGPGNYTFELLAEKNGLRSPVKKISFRVSPLLWQNPWFWLAIFILSGMLVLYFRKKETMISRQNLEIEKTRTEMIRVNNEKEKLQMQVILTQLNPHFINNALQWLQIRLDDREDEEGVSVIAKLSENIRSVFTYSRAQKAFHPLVDELKLTENYLFVQKRRFKDKLHYEMPDQARIQALGEVEIPLLMIQIHVENAVEHGIRNKKENGTLKVSCFQEGEAIVITIEDDGVGRKAAAGMGSTGTGNGTQMLRDMQAFYNKQNTQAMSHTYEDGIFEDVAGNTFGTRVTIRLPLNYTYA